MRLLSHYAHYARDHPRPASVGRVGICQRRRVCWRQKSDTPNSLTMVADRFYPGCLRWLVVADSGWQGTFGKEPSDLNRSVPLREGTNDGPQTGSCTALAAPVGENQWNSRSPLSGQLVCWRFTFNGKTCTSQATTAPFFRRFLYEYEPIGSLPTFPTTPASSRASRAAEA